MIAPTKSRKNTLNAMMNDAQVANRWVVSESLEFYIRKGHVTTLQNNASFFKPCLMIANFGIHKRTTVASRRPAYQMIDFMKEVEINALRYGYSGVFVENVFNPKLRPLLSRFRYRQMHNVGYSAPCYFKSTSCIQSSVKRATSAIDDLQRPSLRCFLRVPDIDQFWIHDQLENVIMFVRRERIGSPSTTPRLRLTMMEACHYKITSESLHADHSFYWSDDKTLFTRLLRKLECRLASEGFDELAINPHTISTWVKSGHSGRANIGVAHDAGRVHMHQLGYQEPSREGGRQIFVKSLRSIGGAYAAVSVN